MAGTNCPNLPQDGIIMQNLKRTSYKMLVESLGVRVISMSSLGEHIFVGVAGRGILIFDVEKGKCKLLHQVSCHAKSTRSDSAADCKDNGLTCYDISVSSKYLVYIKDYKGKLSVCVHSYPTVIKGDFTVLKELEVSRRAPMVVDHALNLFIIGCSAWAVSWTTDKDNGADQNTNESHIRTIDVNTLSTVREWKAADNSISLLRHQATADHNMIGVADSRTGLRVYDLKSPTAKEYACLYHVPVEEIRNFHLVGNFVAVFHKFEPNVTFWNMMEQKTILCINIQDQMRELAEEFLEDDEEDCGLYGDDDDHVTSVTSVPSDEDFVLLYGTKSGCLFGMSVHNRLKLFNIPCPHELPDATAPMRRGIQGLQYLPEGRLAVAYEKYGLTILDFDLENPPDRPPTRCQKRPN